MWKGRWKWVIQLRCRRIEDRQSLEAARRMWNVMTIPSGVASDKDKGFLRSLRYLINGNGTPHHRYWTLVLLSRAMILDMYFRLHCVFRMCAYVPPMLKQVSMKSFSRTLLKSAATYNRNLQPVHLPVDLCRKFPGGIKMLTCFNLLPRALKSNHNCYHNTN
jgi:hypothetical protein